MPCRMLRLALISPALFAGVAAVAAPADVAFEPCDGMICLPVTLADGRSHLLLIDTGNVNSWLAAGTARALHLKLEPIEQQGKAVPGIFRLGPQTVSLGGASLTGRFLAFEPEQAGELPPKVEGALAYTLFREQVLQVDYPHHRVRVLQAPAAPGAAEGAAMALITFGKDGPPVIVAGGFTVNGRAVHAQIDTCYTGTLLIYDAAIASLDLKGAAAETRPKFFPYTDGGVTMNEAKARSVAFGAYVAAPATIYFPGAGAVPVHQPDGLFEATVGNALLQHGVLTLDFRSMRVSVRPG